MFTLQQIGLVLLRTVIGWHFAYEGYYKLMLPGWNLAGEPLTEWSAAGYLRAATGPLAPALHALATNAQAMAVVDVIVPVGLLLVGVSLLLGLFTQLGCLGAMAFLTLFYLSAIPTTGMPQPNAEGTYLFVNKNLVELVAVFVVLVFRTGRIAGLDLLFQRRRAVAPAAPPRSAEL